MEVDSCTLCDHLIDLEGRGYSKGLTYIVRCLQCGEYVISIPTAATAKADWSAETKAALSCAARQASDAGAPLQIQRKSVVEVAPFHLKTRVFENREKLLQQIAKRAPRPNQGAFFSLNDDFTLIDCFSREEFEWYVEWLGTEGLAFKTGGGRTQYTLRFP